MIARTNAAEAPSVVLVHGGFVDGSGWKSVYKILKKDGYNVSHRSESDDIAGRRCGRNQAHRARAERPGDSRRPLLWRCGDHRGRQRSEGRGACLYRGFCPGQRRVGSHAYQGPAARRTRAADSAAPGRLSVPRQGEVRRRHSRPTWTQEEAAFMADSQVPWGVEALGGHDQRASVEDQAELVPGRHRRQDDPAARPAAHVQARRFDSGRSQRAVMRSTCRSRMRWRRSFEGPSQASRPSARSGSPRETEVARTEYRDCVFQVGGAPATAAHALRVVGRASGLQAAVDA